MSRGIGVNRRRRVKNEMNRRWALRQDLRDKNYLRRKFKNSRGHQEIEFLEMNPQISRGSFLEKRRVGAQGIALTRRVAKKKKIKPQKPIVLS